MIKIIPLILMQTFLVNCAYATSIFNSDVENLIETMKAPTPIIADLKVLFLSTLLGKLFRGINHLV